MDSEMQNGYYQSKYDTSHVNDFKTQSSKDQSQSTHQNSDFGNVSCAEISQVEDEFSNSASLSLTETAQDVDDENPTDEMEIVRDVENAPADLELGNSEENMYETDVVIGGTDHENVVQMQSVPECSHTSVSENRRNFQCQLADLEEAQEVTPSPIERLKYYIDLIGDVLQGQNTDGVERQLTLNLTDASPIHIQEMFGVAETQLELINQIISETSERLERESQ